MKKISLSLVTLLMLSISSLGIANTKIGVLDINKVLATISQIKTMQVELKKKFDPRGKQVISLQNSFRNDITNYRKNNTKLKGNALKQQQQKLIDENKKLQETRLKFQKDLVTAQNIELEPILKQIKGIANDIAKKQKIDLIVTKNSTVFNDSKLEITKQVISAMNKRTTSNKKRK